MRWGIGEVGMMVWIGEVGMVVIQFGWLVKFVVVVVCVWAMYDWGVG